MRRMLLVAAFLLTWVVAAGAQSVPNPTVTEAPPATMPGDPSHNYPFFATNIDLASRGYIEEEFFLRGTANTYNLLPDVPKLDTAVVTGSGFPYKTRMIVRRPLSAEQFNGTVVMEWLNVTAGFDLDGLWLASHDHLMRRGYAWVGVSAQKQGVRTLKGWSPARYGGPSGLSVPDDALAWDIFSQAAQSVRYPQGLDPMGGLNVQRILAVGWSQSAKRLDSYYNAIQPLNGIFDAFLLVADHSAEGAVLRTDLPTKAFKVLPETDVAGDDRHKSQAWIRQKPGQFQYRSFWRWEVAGAAHLDHHDIEQAKPLMARESLPPVPENCQDPPFSRIPFHYVVNAAYDHLVEWVKHDVEPPPAPDIEIASLGEQISVIARDSFGNALGGIRLAQHAVPTATNTGLNYPAAAPPTTDFCRDFGSHVPFDQFTLDSLYSDHQTYLDLVIGITHENQKAGFIVGADAAATIRYAAHSDIGRK